jgi:signal transduction histidine kinase
LPIQATKNKPVVGSITEVSGTGAPARPDAHDRFLGTPRLVLLTLAFATLIAMAITVTVLTQRNREAFDLATTTQAQLRDIAIATELLESAETAERGFLLTEREPYLEPYNNAALRIPAQLDAVVTQTAGLPIAETAQHFRTVGLAKLAEITETLGIYKADGRGAATEEVLTDRGKALMDQIRADGAAIRDFLGQELTGRLDRARSTGRLLAAAQIGSTALVLIIAILTGLGLYRNVAALRAAQAELAETNSNLEAIVAARTKALSQANDEIQKFAYIVSHDLRAPLVNIMGFAAELEAAAKTVGGYIKQRDGAADGDVPPEVKQAIAEDVPEAFAFIKTSTSKMDRLIAAILRLSREGRRVLAPEPLSMRALLENVAATLKHRTDECGAQIVVQPLPDIVADRLAVEQVFGNLLDNSVKYLSPERPGVITVRGTAAGASVVYEVEDNGRGIAPADRERVFELFRRAGQQNTQGEGIGLAYVRQLVYRLGGTIELHSTLGQGTIFRLSLPVGGNAPSKESA